MRTIVAAKALVIVGDEGLVLRNSDTHPRWPLQGDMPGGTIEEGETIEDGLIREVEEETSIRLERSQIKELYTMTYSDDEIVVMYHFFAVHLDTKPEIVMDFEHDQFSWVKLTDIKGIEEPYQQGIDNALSHGLI